MHNSRACKWEWEFGTKLSAVALQSDIARFYGDLQRKRAIILSYIPVAITSADAKGVENNLVFFSEE